MHESEKQVQVGVAALMPLGEARGVKSIWINDRRHNAPEDENDTAVKERLEKTQ